MNTSCSCDNFANEENDQRYVTLIRYLSITNNKNLIIISVDVTKIKVSESKKNNGDFVIAIISYSGYS